MSPKEQILNEIKRNARILKESHVKAQRLSESIIAEKKASCQSYKGKIISDFEVKQSKANEKRFDGVREIKSTYQKRIELEEKLFDNRIKGIEREVKELILDGWSGLEFGHECWHQYQPIIDGDGGIPKLTRMGELAAKGQNITINLPALLPIIGANHVFLKAAGHKKDQAVETMQCLMLRLLSALPAAKLKFILIDAEGLGTNMAGFLNLPEDLIGGKPWTEENHIEQCLADLTEHMEMVIQKYLKNRYNNMEDYNTKAGEVAEPYRIVAVANFPSRFNESSARRLVSIAANGPQTGVHVLATIDKNQPLPYGFELSELERTGTVIDFTDNGLRWQDKNFLKYDFQLDKLPGTEMFNRIVIPIGEASKNAQAVKVPFDKVMPDPSDWWNEDSGNELIAPIGKAGADEHLLFQLGKGTAQHALIAGKTGSGKSNLLHVIIMCLAIKYSPDDIEFYLIDFKKGVEFKDYAVFELPHAKVIAIQSEREFGLSVLEGLDRELQRRGDLFRQAGLSHIQQFREKFGDERMPRILLLVDEYQEFFSEEDAITGKVSLILDRLVKQGRAFGIHVLLASQVIASTYSMSRSTTDQMAVRIALQCSDADSRLILGDDNPAARLLSRPGEAYYNAANGAIEGNTLFQVFLLVDELRRELLQKICDKVDETSLPRHPPIIFEGNAPAEFDQNEEFLNFIETKNYAQNDKVVKGWLGESIAIGPHTFAPFRRQSRSNLLIVGQDEKAATAMLLTAVFSIMAQHSPTEASFIFLNLCNVDAEWHDLPKQLAASMPHEIDIGRRREEIDAIAKLANKVKRRSAQDDANRQSACYLIIAGLHWARDLRSADPYEPSSDAENLALVLRDGPDLGLHALIWCNTIASFERVLQRRLIFEFDMRVALQMSEDDSNSLLNTSLANKLGPDRALYYDEERAGHLEKFRPYALPERSLIETCGKKLSEKFKVA